MDEEIKELLEQNLEYSKEIHQMTKKIKNYVTFQKFMSLIYILIIVVPIILGVIYLPPLLGNIFDQYKDILGLQPGGNSIQEILKNATGGLNLNNANLKEADLKNIDVDQLPDSVKALLKK